MAKRIKSKKIKIGFEYGLESIILILLFGLVTFLTGRYFGKTENYSSKINKIHHKQNNFDEERVRLILANLNKI